MKLVSFCHTLFNILLDLLFYSFLGVIGVSGLGFLVHGAKSNIKPPEALMAFALACVFVTFPFVILRSISKIASLRRTVDELTRKRGLDAEALKRISARFDEFRASSENTKSGKRKKK
jgi:hypothetical protein